MEEAVKLLKGESFDLVVTDVKLDRRSSSQIVKGLKAASAEVAVMILTESGDTAAPSETEVVDEAPEKRILPGSQKLEEL